MGGQVQLFKTIYLRPGIVQDCNRKLFKSLFIQIFKFWKETDRVGDNLLQSRLFNDRFTLLYNLYTKIHNYTLQSCGKPCRCYIMIYSCSYDDLPGGVGGEADRQAVCVRYLQLGRGGETLGQAVVCAMLKHLKRGRTQSQTWTKDRFSNIHPQNLTFFGEIENPFAP